MEKQIFSKKMNDKKTLEDIELENKIFEIRPEFFNIYRFVIMNSLFRYGELDFPVLKNVSRSKSDGHLASHIRALEKSKIIISEKEEHDGRRRTFYMLTEQGQKEFKNLTSILKASMKEIENT